PSVAHQWDIERFNSFVGNTLISVSSALINKKVYDWAWLDEWDLKDRENKTKKTYTQENFEILKNAGYKVALVTPELHRTSPEGYGLESHPDAENKERLFERIEEIISLKPDALCTDYSEEIKKLI
ncbi:MAG: hypothetical protein KKE50_06485, partial [Nanoarchaeota archaeon]|nr:hypothetical protein [Nanoarchaeota archaeon]